MTSAGTDRLLDTDRKIPYLDFLSLCHFVDAVVKDKETFFTVVVVKSVLISSND